MRIKDVIELASAMNSKGTKKVALKWNDLTDTLYIQEENEIKPIKDDRLDDLLDRPYHEPEVDKETIDLLKYELTNLDYKITELTKKSENWVRIKAIKKKPAPLTDFEKKVQYYHFLYNNDCGQGDGKLWPGMKRMPREWVELRWNNIVRHYQSLGFWITK